jgi:hypothetical protein
MRRRSAGRRFAVTRAETKLRHLSDPMDLRMVLFMFRLSIANAPCIAEVDGQEEQLGADLSRTVSDRTDDDMDLFAAINPRLVVSGFVVGMLVGLTGEGGGSLMTPILVLLFGVHATTAVGTDLLYAAITKTGGTLTHGLKGTVD